MGKHVSDQLDMFAAAEKVDEWPNKTASEEDGSAIRAGLEALAAQGPPVPEPKLNVMARFLAGIMFPGAGKYENLSAAKRKTAERAAKAAADVFTNHTEEGNDG